jgi:hypothetical protein
MLATTKPQSLSQTPPQTPSTRTLVYTATRKTGRQGVLQRLTVDVGTVRVVSSLAFVRSWWEQVGAGKVSSPVMFVNGDHAAAKTAATTTTTLILDNVTNTSFYKALNLDALLDKYRTVYLIHTDPSTSVPAALLCTFPIDHRVLVNGCSKNTAYKTQCETLFGVCPFATPGLDPLQALHWRDSQVHCMPGVWEPPPPVPVPDGTGRGDKPMKQAPDPVTPGFDFLETLPILPVPAHTRELWVHFTFHGPQKKHRPRVIDAVDKSLKQVMHIARPTIAKAIVCPPDGEEDLYFYFQLPVARFTTFSVLVLDVIDTLRRAKHITHGSIVL